MMWFGKKNKDVPDSVEKLMAPPRRPAADPLAQLRAADAAIVTDLRMAALAERSTWAGWSLYVIAALLCAGGYWAWWARLDEVTVGSGQVVPSTRELAVQSVDGGVLGELLVREGDRVEKDQIVARMDLTRATAFYREGEVKAVGLRAAAVRLRAEAAGTAPVFPAELRLEAPQQVALELNAYRSRALGLQATLESRQQALRLAQDELRMTAPLAEKGIVSDVEVLRLRRQVAELEGQIGDLRNKYRADAAAELSKTESELKALGAAVTGRADQVRQTTLRAPVRGVVKNVRTSAGAVLRPGEELMEIIPSEGALLVDAKIRPSDVAFLRPGLPTKVKLSAYDFSIYGALSGVIESISPDTVPDEQRRGETFYRVRVRTNNDALRDRRGHPLPIIPGMTATVEVLTGQRSVMDYLLKPVLKARDALRER